MQTFLMQESPHFILWAFLVLWNSFYEFYSGEYVKHFWLFLVVCATVTGASCIETGSGREKVCGCLDMLRSHVRRETEDSIPYICLGKVKKELYARFKGACWSSYNKLVLVIENDKDKNFWCLVGSSTFCDFYFQYPEDKNIDLSPERILWEKDIDELIHQKLLPANSSEASCSFWNEEVEAREAGQELEVGVLGHFSLTPVVPLPPKKVFVRPDDLSSGAGAGSSADFSSAEKCHGSMLKYFRDGHHKKHRGREATHFYQDGGDSYLKIGGNWYKVSYWDDLRMAVKKGGFARDSGVFLVESFVEQTKKIICLTDPHLTFDHYILFDIEREKSLHRSRGWDSPGNIFGLADFLAAEEMQGARDDMEDRVAYACFDEWVISVVIDGHGGDQVADILGDVKSGFVATLVEKKSEFLKNPQAVLNQVCMEFDKQCKDKLSGAVLTGFACDRKSGSAYTVNVGDSRTVFAKIDGTVIHATRDHKPTDEEEKTYIEKKRGFVENGRLCGSLAVARAFGDKRYKDKGLRATPDITQSPPLRGLRFIIVACDGVWDKISSKEAARFVSVLRRNRYSLDFCARYLIARAARAGSGDNISAVVFDRGFPDHWTEIPSVEYLCKAERLSSIKDVSYFPWGRPLDVGTKDWRNYEKLVLLSGLHKNYWGLIPKGSDEIEAYEWKEEDGYVFSYPLSIDRPEVLKSWAVADLIAKGYLPNEEQERFLREKEILEKAEMYKMIGRNFYK